MSIIKAFFRGKIAGAIGMGVLSLLAASSAFAQSGTVVADFGYRQSSAHPIPAYMLGAGSGGAVHPGSLPLLTHGGLYYTRFHAYIENIYKTKTPDWTYFDQQMRAVQNAGMHVILEVDHTPTWLLPSPNPCKSGQDPNYAYPRDVNTFASLAASLVHHLDANFPGVVQDYEIWNEPDGGGMCAPDTTEATRLKTYMSIYAATAPALRAAAAHDGVSIRIGGPTLGSSAATASRWLPTFLSDSRTAPYVDFVSYHYYPTGPYDASHGMTWSGTNGTPSLYQKTQNVNIGVAAVYKQVSALVRKGSQPHASTTPIYYDEYNSDWGFVLDCCRNNPTYAPVWNALVFADLLNTAYAGANVPAKILYYAISNPPFCLAGKVDANMDCTYGSAYTPEAYPQYYALDLFSSPSFLDLKYGGHMALSLQQANSSLVATAFTTNAGDTIVIVNPTGTYFGGVGAVANHPGYSTVHASGYLLNSSNRTIATESFPVSVANGAARVTVSVPPYSVLAITFHP